MSLIWAMMILPLADALQNCLQNLTSRIAGLDNEQMTGRAMGMGAMLGYGIGAIKEQFKTPQANNNINNSDNSSQGGGINGFLGRVKNIVNPNMTLSDSTDYNGNVNPIRDVIENKKASVLNNNNSIPNNISNEESRSQMSNGTLEKTKKITSTVVKTGYQVGKEYLKIGANMAEGNFNMNYNTNKPNARNNKYRKDLNNTEYLTTSSRLANMEGDKNEFKGSD